MMRAKELIGALNRKFGTRNLSQLALKLGMTRPALDNWNNSESDLRPLHIANAIYKAHEAGFKDAQRHTIKPIVEFFRLNAVESRKGARYEIFPTSDGHPLFKGLRDELCRSRGIYIFFDSRGHALYVGKTKKQPLWNEMNNAFNREREIQKIMLVKHPARKQSFLSSSQQERRIVRTSVFLYELAHYFSAYEIENGMINDLEALLVRSFANNLLNKNMERFKP